MNLSIKSFSRFTGYRFIGDRFIGHGFIGYRFIGYRLIGHGFTGYRFTGVGSVGRTWGRTLGVVSTDVAHRRPPGRRDSDRRGRRATHGRPTPARVPGGSDVPSMAARGRLGRTRDDRVALLRAPTGTRVAPSRCRVGRRDPPGRVPVRIIGDGENDRGTARQASFARRAYRILCSNLLKCL
jgi:hypothetical protein